MKRLSLAVAALLSLFLLPAAAHAAAGGYATANVNMRSGPSTWYPAVTVVPAGSPVVVYGCIHDLSWCDVGWGPVRGWINSFYLSVPYQSRRVIIAQAPWIGMPVISFHFDAYWNRHYRSRPFYRDRTRWERRHRDYWSVRQPSRPGRSDQAAPEPRWTPPHQQQHSAPPRQRRDRSGGGWQAERQRDSQGRPPWRDVGDSDTRGLGR